MTTSCKSCKSNRVISVSAKCSDCCGVNLGNVSHEGYVPEGLGIGGGDYIDFDLCLDCGQLQGDFPRPPSKMEKDISDEQVVEFFNNYFPTGTSDYLKNQPYFVRIQIINHADDLSSSFGRFIKDYFDLNSDRTPTCKHPSVERFVQMFRNNDADLG